MFLYFCLLLVRSAINVGVIGSSKRAMEVFVFVETCDDVIYHANTSCLHIDMKAA